MSHSADEGTPSLSKSSMRLPARVSSPRMRRADAESDGQISGVGDAWWRCADGTSRTFPRKHSTKGVRSGTLCRMTLPRVFQVGAAVPLPDGGGSKAYGGGRLTVSRDAVE